jgi:uncharacterized protein with HEPN domain
MQPEDQARLRHLAEAATKAVAYSKDKRRADLDDDELLRLALTKPVEIVGEAAKHISPELRAANPDIPWAAAARIRQRAQAAEEHDPPVDDDGPYGWRRKSLQLERGIAYVSASGE